MSGKGGPARRRGRGPAPVRAGAHLLCHDIKNLAARLSALCQNLSQSYDDPALRRTALAMLDDTVDHLKRMAAEVREREGRVLVKLKVDVNSILEGALLDTRPDLAGKVKLVERFGRLPAIWADAYLLRRAFASAIENSLEALKGSGTLSVSTAMRRRAGHPKILVEVRDDGPGMTAEFLRERLGHPFASTKKEGLGLGVYTMAQVAAVHGGRIRVVSAPGRGTRVRFLLPALDE